MLTAIAHDEGYFLPEDIEMIYETKWKVSHNASRSGIRLVGPVPKWARKDGGEGGAHPSNLVEFGYPLGTLNWTGDDPCIFPVCKTRAQTLCEGSLLTSYPDLRSIALISVASFARPPSYVQIGGRWVKSRPAIRSSTSE
jgi:hypothetical protein